MKIAYDHQIFGWQKYGGISRYFYELAQNISSIDDVNVKVISPLFINEYLAKGNVKVDGVHVPQLRKTSRIYRIMNQLITPWSLSHFRPDVIHETYYAVNSIAKKNAKIVITVHDMIHELFPNSFSSRDTTSYEKFAAVNRADHVICISENTRNDLIRLFNIAPDKTSVVHHGFELLAQPSNNIPIKNPYILYVGSRGGYKNFSMLLRAYSQSPHIHNNFELVTFGGGHFTLQEQTLIHQLGSGKLRIRYLTGNDQLLADLYASATAFVYPSLYEGFGIPPLEAMSCNCPVICSNTSSIPEVAGSAAEYFDPSQLDSLLNALTNVLFDTSYRESLIAKGQQHTSYFSWKKCAQKTLSIYQKVSA